MYKVNLLLLIILLVSPLSLAQKQDKLVAAGQLLAIVDILEILSKSECSYLFKRKSYSVNNILNQIDGYLTENEKKEIRLFMKSKWIKQHEENKEIALKPLRMLSAEYDEKTACGVMMGMYSMPYENAMNVWNMSKGTVNLP